MRSLAIIVAALAACGGKSSTKDAPRCLGVLTQLQALGVIAGGGANALAVGLSCHDLTDDDLACVARAKRTEDLNPCRHAGIAVLVEVDKLESIGSQVGQGDAPDDFVAAVCACQDTACLVALGEARQRELRAFLSGPHAARMSQCLAARSPAVKKP
jgi:hypothetical protein